MPTDPPPPELPQPTPRQRTGQAVRFLLTAVGLAVAVNRLSSGEWWLVLMLDAVLVALIIAAWTGGAFFERYRTSRLASGIALLLLAVQPIASALLARSQSFWSSIATIIPLWLATVIITWRTLRIRRGPVWVAVAFLVVGMGLLLAGVGFLRHGGVLNGTAYVLLAGAFVMVSVGILLERHVLVDVATLMAAATFLWAGVGFLRHGYVWVAAAFLLSAGAFLMVSVASGRRGSPVLSAASTVALGVCSVALGTWLVAHGEMVGASLVVTGIAVGLMGIGSWCRAYRLVWFAYLIAAACWVVAGIALSMRDTLLGVALVLAGLASASVWLFRKERVDAGRRRISALWGHLIAPRPERNDKFPPGDPK